VEEKFRGAGKQTQFRRDRASVIENCFRVEADSKKLHGNRGGIVSNQKLCAEFSKVARG